MRSKDKQVRIDSSEVQGEGSFVMVKSTSWGLLRKAQKMTASGADAATVGIEFAEQMVQECLIKARDKGLYRGITDCGAAASADSGCGLPATLQPEDDALGERGRREV